MPMAKGPVFSPDPARLIADQNLTALDIRVLMAIAVHDRFSKNGIGCTASHTRLASLVGCHLKSLSRSIRTLAERGYIGGRANPLNPKSRCYYVVYNDMDEAILKSVKGNQPVTYTGNEPVTNQAPTGNQFATPQVTNSFHIGNQLQKNAQSIQGDAGYNIFSETVRDLVETREIDPAEAASPAVPPSDKGNERANSVSIGAMLAMIERGKKAGQIKNLKQWFDWLDGLVGDRGTLDQLDANYWRACRLFEEIGGALDAA
ncbi:MAG: helix-turn-helix domain-containing protein [Mesorhizobium sp.]|nr:MAG: helix-turn-helix domain-containing protein [Mesorhizobium sp.]RWG72324.1 MAG: helix-turn-helix domain-containing protein [Mesorhizobium sp.]RWG74374.1 MAG: helix-turn-helix domain-containing protein [Mesorhizobium sp.]RWH67523.1 MAG: helix-turn-helix domain-containing protein [Mesorhizobium sp.]TIN58072.1 MAG: helix-turn-helix domain-containing protein [Mesorhizobium sp.]